MHKFFVAFALFFIAYLHTSCGAYLPKDDDPAPGGGRPPSAGGGGNPGGGSVDDFAEVQAIVDKDCNRCHGAGVHPLKFDSEAKLRNSNSLTRVSNGTMPPDKPLAADAKQKIIDFLKN